MTEPAAPPEAAAAAAAAAAGAPAATPSPSAAPQPPADDASVADHDRYWLDHVYQADRVPQLTARALITGCVIGGVMSFSNLYIGLKTGWGLGASITSAIIAYALFSTWQRYARTPADRHFTVLENNTMQTAASAAAYMTSAGLVAAIPALYLVSKDAIAKDPSALPALYHRAADGSVAFDVVVAIPWLIGICLVGVVAAIPVKRKLINQERLRFPSGVACAETLRTLHGEGDAGAQQARGLFAGASVAAVFTLLKDGFKAIPGQVELFGAGLGKIKVALGTELWTLGAGAIMGMRVTASMLAIGILTFVIAPAPLLEAGFIRCAKVPEGAVCSPEHLGYADITAWTLWPGVALMVSHSLVGLLLQAPQMVRGLRRTLAAGSDPAAVAADAALAARLAAIEVPPRWFWLGLLVAGGASIALQALYFDIAPLYGALSVVLALALAFVAARSVAETDINPIGAMGKVTQLVFGGALPGQIVPNLMTASVTGGAASQTGDLLTDMKTGYLLGANPRAQVVAQVSGVFVGAVFAAIAFSVLVKPEELGGAEWPAPAAMIWAKVAELLSKGIDHVEGHKLTAMAWAGGLGGLMAVVETQVPAHVRRYMPSVAGGGVAAMVPFVYSFNMFLGAVAALVLQRLRPAFALTFLVVLASGLIAGETLMGVLIKFYEVLGGG